MPAPAATKDGKKGERDTRARRASRERRGESPYRDDDPAGRSGPSAIAQGFLTRYGTLEAALQALADENFQYRERHRKDKEQIEGLELELPEEGAVVLTGDDAKAWTAFQELKLKPEEVKAAIAKRDELQKKVETSEREKLYAEAAQAVGYKPSVLSDLAESKQLHVEMRDVSVEENGQTVTRKVPHVRPRAEEKAQLVPLAQHVEQHLKDYLPSLKADAQGGGTGTGGGMTGTTGSQSSSTTTTATTPWPSQGGGGSGSGAGSGDVVSNFLRQHEEQAKKIKDPLAPK